MCGFTGYLTLATTFDTTTSVIRDMIAIQKHRGPDDSGIVGINTSSKEYEEVHANGNENISDAQVNAEIAFLNRTFRNLDPDSTFRRSGMFVTPSGDTNYYDNRSLAADAEIEFRLAKKDPQGNCTNGIVRIYTPLTSKGNDDLKKNSVWDTKKYFNMWVVRSINKGNTIGIAGYAQFPFGPGGGASTDGIMVMSSYFGTNDETVTHEVGHWLGLYHPFQISSDSCGLDGDGVMDTPPTYFNPTTAEPLRNRCNNKSFNTCSSEKPDLPDMQENYMDYFTGSCACSKKGGHYFRQSWWRC
jgi:hypothetical protein